MSSHVWERVRPSERTRRAPVNNSCHKATGTSGAPSLSGQPVAMPSGNHNHGPNTSALRVTRIRDSVEKTHCEDTKCPVLKATDDSSIYKCKRLETDPRPQQPHVMQQVAEALQATKG